MRTRRMMINKSESLSWCVLVWLEEGGKWQLVAKSMGRTWLARVWRSSCICRLLHCHFLHCSCQRVPIACSSHKWWCSQAVAVPARSNWWSASNDLGHWGRHSQSLDLNSKNTCCKARSEGSHAYRYPTRPRLRLSGGGRKLALLQWTTQWSCHELMKSTCLGNPFYKANTKTQSDIFLSFNPEIWS